MNIAQVLKGGVEEVEIGGITWLKRTTVTSS